MRDAHKLIENKKTMIPNSIITYDTETYSIENDDGTKTHKLKVGVANYWHTRNGKSSTESITFYDVKTFWDFVESKTGIKKKLYLFAHNAQFDSLIVNMFKELPDRGWNLDKSIIDANIFIVRWEKGNVGTKEQEYRDRDLRGLVCLDTLNYFKASLREIGEKLGFEKLEIDIEKSVKTKTVSEELIAYCKRDVDITEKILLEWFKFLKDNNLGNFQPTIASQAFTAFRHRFMKNSIYIHDNERAIEIERNSYKGGRNECFFIGQLKEKIFCYDFNSLYPSVMIDHEYPTNLVSCRLQNDIETLKSDLEKHLVIAELTIKIDKPIVAHRKERLLFPIGKFTGTFCSPEIKILLERNCIINVGKVCCYNGAKIFTEYVEFFYNERLKAKEKKDKISDEMFKIMLNSLYGKFGQRLRKNELIGDADTNEISVKRIIDADDNLFTQKTFGGKVFLCSSSKEESYNSFPAIASFCTAYARTKLLLAIEKAQWENVYYVDTDSLFVNEKGKENLKDLIDDKKLGYLKLEYEAPLGMIIKGCKDYIIFKKNKSGYTEKIEKIKGVPRKAFKNNQNEYELIKFDKFATALRHGQLDRITQRNMIKQLSRDYTKGIITDTGKVEPFILDE